MKQQKHRLTPPSELVDKWNNLPLSPQEIIAIAWQHGANQELDACCELLEADSYFGVAHYLRSSRRPQPPTLKEQALDELNRIPTHDSEGRSVDVDVSILRRAIESIPDPRSESDFNA